MPLPPGVELSAYRIVQEALTNALKHAGRGAGARSSIRYGAARARARGRRRRPRPDASASGAGHGLVGMRERVALYGGTLDAGTRRAAATRVRARLPLRDDAPMIRVLIADDQELVRTASA